MTENAALHHVPVGTVFQLDDTPPHFSHHVHAFWDREFHHHLIGRRGRGFVKDAVYTEKNSECE
jgi:hypothetical protein